MGASAIVGAGIGGGREEATGGRRRKAGGLERSAPKERAKEIDRPSAKRE